MAKSTISAILGKFGEPDHGYVVHPMATFLPLDVESIKKSLKVEETAILRGQQNLPKEDIETYDEVERSIVQRIEKYFFTAKEDFDSGMKAYTSRLSGLNFHTTCSDIENTARQTRSDFNSAINKARISLEQLQKDRTSDLADLQIFREQNKLDYNARLPKWPNYLSWAILAFICALETILNGTFFGERLEGGLVGGFVEAIIFAMINVACGYILGRYGATRLVHIKKSTVIYGVFIVLFMVVAIFLNNMFAAHYRSALVAGVEIDTATTVALDNLMQSFFGISDLKSWLLMGIGLLAATLAAMKGWHMDEPYLLYGDKVRKYNMSVDGFITVKRDIMNEVTKYRDDATKKMSGSLKSLESGLSEYKMILDYRQSFYDAFLSHSKHLENAANELLISYRQKNIEKRNSPAPVHFSTKFNFTIPNIAKPSLNDKEISEISSLLDSVKNELTEQQNLLHESYDKAHATLTDIK